MAEKDSKFAQLKGNAKETIGNAVGNEKMEKEGMQEKAAGKAKEYVEKGTDKANESIDNFSDKFKK